MAGFGNDKRKLTREEKAETSARFNEILKIVKRYDVDGELSPQQTVDLIQDLGTTFVKLGQIASTHPDMLPPEYCEALGKLRTQARPIPIEDVKAQIEKELGKPVDELFKSFDEKPLGSASIAQVHRAELPTGEIVAVKVQRPGVVEQVTNDLNILQQLAELNDFVNKGKGLSLKGLVDELAKTSKEELDFTNEARNVARFYANNENREGISSPRCYEDYCTPAILTEDFVSAPAAEKIDEMGFTEEAREKLAYLVASNYMQQVMEDGFYHADPHAGNVMLPKEGGVEWIDFGMMGTATATQRGALKDIILSLVKSDSYGLKRAILKVAKPKGYIDHARLLEMCENVSGQFINTDLANFDTGALLESLTQSMEDADLDVDPFLANIGRGLVTLEGTIHHISPKLNIMNVLVDYLEKSFDPASIEREMTKIAGKALESGSAMVALPAKVNETLDMMQKGHLRVGMELSATDKMAGTIRAAAGLVALALIAMGLVVGACVLASSEFALGISGLPFVGGIALIAGLALAIYVFVKTRKYLK